MAREVAIYTVALIAIAATPRLLPIGDGREPRSVLRLAKELRAATVDDVLARPIEALTTMIEQNVSIWLGISTEKAAAFSAILRIIPTLEPDVHRLASANLDPRRLAFYVSDRARAQSPADFFETEAEDPEQAAINAYILRTLLFRSLEHLQRMAMRAWVVRLLEDRLPVPALPEDASLPENTPLPEIDEPLPEWEPEPPSSRERGSSIDLAAGIAEVLGVLLTKPDLARGDEPSGPAPVSGELSEAKDDVDASSETETKSPPDV